MKRYIVKFIYSGASFRGIKAKNEDEAISKGKNNFTNSMMLDDCIIDIEAKDD